MCVVFSSRRPDSEAEKTVFSTLRSICVREAQGEPVQHYSSNLLLEWIEGLDGPHRNTYGR